MALAMRTVLARLCIASAIAPVLYSQAIAMARAVAAAFSLVPMTARPK